MPAAESGTALSTPRYILSYRRRELSTPIKTYSMEAGDMAQQLRVLVALAEDQDLAPRTHIAVHNFNSRGSNTLLWLP